MKKSIHIPKLLIFIFAFSFALIMVHFALLLNYFPADTNGRVEGFLPGFKSIIDSIYTEAIPHHIMQRIREYNFHISLGMAFLISGVLQVSSRAKKKLRKYHKYIGAFYLVIGSITVGTGCWLSIHSFGTFVTAGAFYLMGFFWLYFTGKSLVHLYRKEYALHGIRMAQGFAIALMPLPSRPIVLIMMRVFPSRTMDEIFPVSMWLALVLGIVIAHWYANVELAQVRKR